MSFNANPIKSIIQRRKKDTMPITNNTNNDRTQDLQDYLYQKIPYDFKILGKNNCIATQRIKAILRYHQIFYLQISSPLYLKNLQYRFDKLKNLKQDQKWPGLLVEYNLGQPQLITGQEAILSYFKKDFIKEYLHKTYSAWANQGQLLIQQKIRPQISNLFKNPSLAIENTKLNINNSPHSSYDLLSIMKIQIWQATKIIVKNTPHILFRNRQYLQSKQNLKIGLVEWSERLVGKDFHGGQRPDEADMNMYGLLLAHWNTKSFNEFVLREGKDTKFWIRRMDKCCKFQF